MDQSLYLKIVTSFHVRSSDLIARIWPITRKLSGTTLHPFGHWKASLYPRSPRNEDLIVVVVDDTILFLHIAIASHSHSKWHGSILPLGQYKHLFSRFSAGGTRTRNLRAPATIFYKATLALALFEQ